LFSASAGTANAGLLVGSLAGLGSSKKDPSGDKAVRQLLSQLLTNPGQLPPISPANGLPNKL
jgi:hypothetical protein